MPATLPICVALIARRISNKSLLKQFFRYQTLVITFVAYAAFHASQKPFSVYKVIMLDTCTNASYGTKNCTKQCCGYAPFNAKNGKALLGLLDAIFVGPYAMGLLITSEIMDRLNPRYCIVVGCYFTAFFTLVVGLSFPWKIHDYAFYVTAVFLNGLAQSAAWPVVLSAATSWFDKEQRKGLAFRIWNSHVYVGILVGLLVSGAFVESSLSLSFIIPGSLVAGIGIILFLSLVPHPDPLDQLSDAHNIRRMTRTTPSMQEVPSWFQAKNALEFRVAMRLPGVVEFALGLFFSRMVSYTLSAWLPYYIHATTKLGARPSAFYSVFFTVGALLGGILAGYLHDLTHCAALVSVSSLLLAIPVLYFRDVHLVQQRGVSILFEIACGMLVRGPYTLINTAVAAELGTNRYIMRDNRAFPKVAAIIECTGAIGAAVGPALTGAMLGDSWSDIIHVMMGLEFIAALCLTRGVVNDLKHFSKRGRVDRRMPDPTL